MEEPEPMEEEIKDTKLMEEEAALVPVELLVSGSSTR